METNQGHIEESVIPAKLMAFRLRESGGASPIAFRRLLFRPLCVGIEMPGTHHPDASAQKNEDRANGEGELQARVIGYQADKHR